MIYKVTHWNGLKTITVEIEADNHQDAAKKSGLIRPDAIINVDGPIRCNIRYQVDTAGKLHEIAQYQA